MSLSLTVSESDHDLQHGRILSLLAAQHELAQQSESEFSNRHVQIWIFEHAKITDTIVTVVSTWNTNWCEHFDSIVHVKLYPHANTKGVF